MKRIYGLLLIFLVSSIAASGQTLVAHGCTATNTLTLNDAGTGLFKFVTISYYSTAGTLSDSESTAYTALPTDIATFHRSPWISYVAANATGASSDVYTASTGFDYVSMCVQVWSGMPTTYTLGANSGYSPTNPTATIAAGSITPASGYTWLAIASNDNASGALTVTVDSGYTISDQLSGTSQWFGVALASKVVTGGLATNPTWTLSSSGITPLASIYSFQVSASAPPLTAGVVSQSALTASSVSLSATDASGGTAPYSYQWYRSTTSGFTPGSGNLLSGATARTLTDAGLTVGTTYYYVIKYTDSVSAVAYASQFGATPQALSSGVVSKTSDSSTSVSLAATAAAGGNPPYTYQWYRSATNGFTPGSGSILSGASSLTLSDTGLSPVTTYYYVIASTDSASAVVYSAQFTETTPATSVVIGFIGDSISCGYLSASGTTPAIQEQRDLFKTETVNTTFTISNSCMSGTATADWASGGSILTSALAAFTGAGVSVVQIMLGTNDAKTTVNTTSSVYQSNLSGTIAAIKASGIGKIVLNYSPYINSNSGWNITSSNALLVQYQTVQQALAAADPTHVMIGDALSYQWFQDNATELNDGVHPTDIGYTSLGFLWAQAYARLFMSSATAGTVAFAVIQ